MNRIPHHIDELLWLVAESGDRDAIRDFEERYPMYVLELGKRIAMVRDLKGSRKVAAPDRPAPRFIPPQSAPMRPSFRMGWAFAAVAMAALGFSAFVATQKFLGPTAKRPIVAGPPSDRGTVGQPSPNGVGPGQGYPDPNPIVPNPTNANNEPLPDHMLPHDVVQRRADLSSAIKAIATTCGLTLEIAPGLSDAEVSLDYRGLTGLAMLQDLGPKFGFTAFDEGNGKVLIIPAIDGDSSFSKADPVAEGGASRAPSNDASTSKEPDRARTSPVHRGGGEF